MFSRIQTISLRDKFLNRRKEKFIIFHKKKKTTTTKKPIANVVRAVHFVELTWILYSVKAFI